MNSKENSHVAFVAAVLLFICFMVTNFEIDIESRRFIAMALLNIFVALIGIYNELRRRGD